MVDSGEVFASYNFYISLIVLYFAGSIASAGGIGGGGVNVPLLLVLGGFDYKDAVVFSLCTVLGNHLAQSYINWPISHPYVKQRPLIYWDLILFLLPTQLGGSNLGVIISDAPPELLLLICAFLILALAIAKTYYKFMSYYHEESKGEAKSKYQKLVHYANECETHSRSQSLQSGCTSKYSIDESNSALLSSIAVEEGNKSGFQVPLLSTIPEDPAETSILSANDFDFTVTLASNNPPENPNEDFAEVNPMARSSGGGNSSTTMSEDILISAVNPTHLPNTTTALISEPPRTYSTSSNALVFRILPTTILGILAGVFMVYVAFFLLLQYTVQSCSAEYYAVLGSLYPFLLYFIYWARGYARNRQKHDAYQFLVKGDVDMEEQSIVLILLIFLVGVLSALLGIGGGELMGPLFLSYHILPPVSTATTSMMSLLNTANSIIHYAIDGKINYSVSALFLLVGLLAGATGRATALHLLKKYKKNSVLVLMLMTILSISAILLIYEMVEAESDFTFHALC